MSDTRPSSLGDRIEQVCQAHNLNDRSWSLKAGLSEGYLATQRTRAADDPSFVLPEKSARKLAAVAKINVARGVGATHRYESSRLLLT